MQALLEHFITQSTVYSLMAVVLVAFLESLALVGLILPGTVLMAGLGALIGSGELSFWHAWLAGIIGCLMGDWISFWLGWRFKKPLHRWSFLKKNKALLDKTEHALHQHSMFTILVGRFVGPTRPLAQALAFACVLSIGDFGVVALFGNDDFRTLPFYLYQQIGSYRSQDGAVTALILLLLCFLLFTVIEKLPGRNVKTD
jgi:membrane protein DedA with SNARE-associated domain